MTHKQALKLRAAISAIISLCRDNRYEVAIQQRWPFQEDGEWEVHIFVREDDKSGLMGCALLANAIETISADLLATHSQYNMATSGEPNYKPSFKIW